MEFAILTFSCIHVRVSNIGVSFSVSGLRAGLRVFFLFFVLLIIFWEYVVKQRPETGVLNLFFLALVPFITAVLRGTIINRTECYD